MASVLLPFAVQMIAPPSNIWYEPVPVAISSDVG